RTESDLFQQRWTEAQLRAEVLGIEPADADAQDWQRQLLESVRALYRAEMDRQRLVKQLEALVAAAEAGDEQLPLVLAETRDVLREQRNPAGGPDKISGPVP
ncbi:MAG: hypothetical protein GTO53_13925, partial [Planctomycetales bacterium]|nr:hypothetical protein [Planctomycetales bacterium]NIM10186.1 hypothetical protein [Planctomycetales bacterium]NIN78733.1 hypothetical protein [Planctomycetales bacterium]